MDREELSALRNAIDTVLTWPDSVRNEVARWLTPQGAKPNGRGHDPPPFASPENLSGKTESFSPSRSPTPYAGKARPGAPPISAKAAEQRLLTAMRKNPGLTVIALAKAAGAGRSATGDRLRRLAASGEIEKDAAGRWRLVGEATGPTQPPST
jgi:hypothetical protein